MALVRAYLIKRFNLRPAYLGVVAMGDEALGAIKEGVAIVSFYK